MKKILLIIALFVLGCTPQQEKIAEADVIKTVKGFFDAINVDNDNPDLINEYITDDFLIFQGWKKDKEEFLEWVSSWSWIETEFELSDFMVSSDVNSAHISLLNRARFIKQTDSTNLQEKFEVLESAFIVKEEGKLKIKFYFSDVIKFDSKPIK